MKLKDVRLLYNAAAHFSAADRYPEGLINELRKPGSLSFDALCWAMGEMAKQAELMRRHMGETPQAVPTETDFRMNLRPTQLPKATEMVFEALASGMGARDDEEEIDMVLCEIQKQKKTKID